MEEPPVTGIQSWLESLESIDSLAKKIEEEARQRGEEKSFEEILKNLT